MPVMDEFREERATIKQGTFKQKYQYFKDYYRTPLIIAILAAVFIGALVYHFVTQRPPAFYAAMLNCSDYDDNGWFETEFAEAAGIDLRENDVIFDTVMNYTLDSVDETSYITAQKLETYAGVGELDVMLGSGAEFARFANGYFFLDLREILTPEQISRYEPFFYYVDDALIEEAAASQSAETTEIAEWLARLPDPRKPEDMRNPIPIAIYVDGSSKLNKAYYFKNSEDGVALGVYLNSAHIDSDIALIQYLLDQ